MNKKIINILLVAFMTVVMPLPLSAQKSDLLPSKNFTLKNQYKTNIKLTELRGHVVLLNFWADWCGFCVQSLILLEQWQDKYKDRGFSIMAINIQQNAKIQVSKYQNFDINILFDDFGIVSRLYEVESIPMSILIDRDGYIRHILSEEELKNSSGVLNKLETLLDE